MGSPTLVRARPKKGTLIEVSWPAQQRIGINNLELWLEALETLMECVDAKRAYVSRRGFSVQVTFIGPGNARFKWTVRAEHFPKDQEVKP